MQECGCPLFSCLANSSVYSMESLLPFSLPLLAKTNSTRAAHNSVPPAGIELCMSLTAETDDSKATQEEGDSEMEKERISGWAWPVWGGFIFLLFFLFFWGGCLYFQELRQRKT